MLPGTEIQAALAALEPLAPRRHRHQLRHRSGRDERAPARALAARPASRSRACPTPVCRPSSTATCTTTSRPTSSPTSTSASSPSSASAVIGGCCGTTPAHIRRRRSSAAGTSRRPCARPEHEPGATSIYSLVPFEQDTSFLIIGERTNANGSKKFRDAMLAGDLDTCLQMARDQVKEGAHVLDVCVDYVGRDGTLDMARDRVALRHAGRRAAGARLHRARGRSRPACSASAAAPSSTRPTSKTARRAGSRLDRVFKLAKQYGAAVICLLIDEEGQARDVEWKLRIAHRIHDLAVNRYGLEPSDLIFDALTFPLSTGDDDLRRDGIDTIEAIRRIKAEMPGVFTTLGVSNVSLRPQPRGAPRAQQRVPARVRAGRSRLGHRARRQDRAARTRSPSEQRERVPRPRLRPTRPRRRRPRPTRTTTRCRSCSQCSPTSKVGTVEQGRPHRLAARAAALAAHHRRRPRRPRRRSRRGARERTPPLDDHQRHAARRHEGRRRAVRHRRDAAAVRAAVGRDDEDVGRLPRAAHGEGRRQRRQGHASCSPRSRATCTTSARTSSTSSSPTTATRCTTSASRSPITEMIDKALEVGADAIGMSGLLVKSTLIMRDNLEELNARGLANIPVLLGGAALTRTYVERDLRSVYEGRRVLRQGRVRGPPRHGPPGRASSAPATTIPTGAAMLGGRNLPARDRGRGRPVRPSRRAPPRSRPTTRCSSRRSSAPRSCEGIALDDIAGVHQRDRALPQPVAVPSREADRDRRRVQGAHPPDPRASSSPTPRRENLLVPQVVYGYFAANGDGNDLVIWNDESRTAEWMRLQLPAPDQGAVPLHRRLLPSDRVGRGRLRRVPHRHDGRRGQRGHRRAVRRRQVPGLPAAARPRRRDGRGARRATGTAASARSGASPTRTARASPGCSASSTAAVATRGATPRAPTSRTTPRSPSCSAPTASASSAARRPSWQYQPEQTTSALICHHPKAKYFVAR